MTANRNYTTESENSVSRPLRDGENSPVIDPALVQILEYAQKTAGTTTRRDLKIELGLSSSEVDQLLDRLQAEGLVEIIGKSDRQMIVLTGQGEVLGRGWR